jgi:hypothetical protein
MKSFLLILCLFSFNAYSKVSTNELKALDEAVKVLVEADLTCSDVSDCTSIVMGHRACGGPVYFIVSSLLNANAKEIEVLALANRDKSYEYNKENSVVSICSMAMPPRLACEAGLCVKQ